MSKPSHPDTTLTPGTALIIVGPQGSGKTLHAHKIAAAHGAYTEGAIDDLFTHAGLHSLLASEPASVVIEGFPDTHKGVARLKQLVTMKSIEIRRTYSAQPEHIRAPNFIFCSDDIDVAKRLVDSRNFAVVQLQGRGAA